jgi:hypothetical protein
MFNEATRQLKNLIKEVKNYMFQQHLQNLTATEETDYSLWKGTKILKQPIQHNSPIRK